MSIDRFMRLLATSTCCGVCCPYVHAAETYGPDKARTIAARTPNVAGAFPNAAAWAEAPVAGPFPVAGQTDVTRPNTVSALHDDCALYVRVRVNDPGVKGLTPLKEGDSGSRGVWSNDCVELFLGSAADPTAKVHTWPPISLGSDTRTQPWSGARKRNETGKAIP